MLVGLIGGTAVGIQSQIAGAMGQRVGGTASSFIIHLSGLILSGIYLYARGGEKIRDWQSLPWYMLGAGIFGLVLYQTINITLPRLGSTMMIMLIIVGQLLTATVIDHFGLLGAATRPLELSRALGIATLLVGSYLVAR